MALYDGFFDAVWDEQTETYDRTYDSGDFTAYFGAFVGSGVCVYQNPDSMKVSFRQGKAVVAPGYLFIQGYWLKNDAEYELPLEGAGDYAIEARLNTGLRMIQLEAKPKSQAQPSAESLIFAYVTVDSAGAGVAEDTRRDSALCGVIDSAGNMANQAAYAAQYIDTQLEDRLAQAQQQIDQKSAQLEGKIQQVAAVAEQIEPPAIGAIQFSASQNVGPEWLRCDGSFINQQDYPELVQALGKLTPSPEQWTMLSQGQIGSKITNGVRYGGAIWAYSQRTKTLYGIPLAGGQMKEIPVSSQSGSLNAMIDPAAAPTALSILDGELYLVQLRASGTVSGPSPSEVTILYAPDFTGEETTLALEERFAGEWPITYCYASTNGCLPTVAKTTVKGVDTYYMCAGIEVATGSSNLCYWFWTGEDQAPQDKSLSTSYDYYGASNKTGLSKSGFHHKNQGEMIYTKLDGNSKEYQILSLPLGLYNSMEVKTTSSGRTSAQPINGAAVAGEDLVLFDAYWSGQAKKVTLYLMRRSTVSCLAVTPEISLPAGTSIQQDGFLYLADKGIWLLFVGTGFLFSRDLTDKNSFGFLDTTDVLGVISGYCCTDYDPETSNLYILGQDTASRVKLAALRLPELYHYANDGAWLPSIASDGVPAYIKAREEA